MSLKNFRLGQIIWPKLFILKAVSLQPAQDADVQPVELWRFDDRARQVPEKRRLAGKISFLSQGNGIPV
jgi:hypothetical protein